MKGEHRVNMCNAASKGEEHWLEAPKTMYGMAKHCMYIEGKKKNLANFEHLVHVDLMGGDYCWYFENCTATDDEWNKMIRPNDLSILFARAPHTDHLFKKCKPSKWMKDVYWLAPNILFVDFKHNVR